jgi:hypothetical protein
MKTNRRQFVKTTSAAALGLSMSPAMGGILDAYKQPWGVQLFTIPQMAANDFDGWAVVEWECCLKHPEDGAREGAAFVRDHIIRVTERAFDDFADSGTDDAANRRMLGLEG